MFGRKEEKPEPPRKILVVDPKASFRDAELLESMAVAADFDTAIKSDELWASSMEEHERQIAGWLFDCKRFGDFLTLFVERRGNPDTPYYTGATAPLRKFSTSLNIGTTREVRLTLGHAPDRAREAKYRYSAVDKQGTEYSHSSYLPEGGTWKVRSDYFYARAPHERSFVLLDVLPDQQQFGTMGYDERHSYQIKHMFKNAARPAEDDRIRFEGIGATLYTPAGLGQATYDRIMAEIATGAK